MGLLLPVVLCALAACCGATSPPLPPLRFWPPIARGCNDSGILELAGFALQDINRDRKDGYVLSLNRVSDVREHRQVNSLGSLFYFTLDVLETDCHVLSRKAWKDCGVRTLHESVYGQCKALFYVNRPGRVLYVLAYNCTLRPVSRRSIHTMCPDCPSPFKLSNPKVLETAAESLAKYNKESASKQYSLFQVTRASGQWVFGFAFFVEYLIKESPCTKHQASSCALQPPDSVPVGLCKGTLTERELKKFVSVTCDFFEPQTPSETGTSQLRWLRLLNTEIQWISDTEIQYPEEPSPELQVPTPGGENPAANQGPADLPTVEESQQKIIAPTNSPSKAVPKGSVQYLPDLDDEKKPEDAQENSPVEAFPVQLELTTDPLGESLDVSFLFLDPEEKKVDLFRAQWFSTVNAHWNHLEVFKAPVPGSVPRDPDLIAPGRGVNTRIFKSPSVPLVLSDVGQLLLHSTEDVGDIIRTGERWGDFWRRSAGRGRKPALLPIPPTHQESLYKILCWDIL
ncbi:fetuin-B isoform X2 [Prionailurus iriomotensis]